MLYKRYPSDVILLSSHRIVVDRYNSPREQNLPCFAAVLQQVDRIYLTFLIVLFFGLCDLVSRRSFSSVSRGAYLCGKTSSHERACNDDARITQSGF